MEKKVLVAYSSSHGSTQEIAAVVAEKLNNRGLAAEQLPVRKVRTLDGCSGVVLGMPLYMFHWPHEMLHFLSRHKKLLTGGLPCAIFTGGSITSGDEKELQEVRNQVDKELARVAWLKPVSIQIVGGKFDPARLRLPWSLLPALRNMPACDYRDWPAICTWAESLVAHFQPALIK